MRMRINEAGEDNTSAEIEFARVARVAEAFDAAARADGGDASVANQQCAIANDAKIAERTATAWCDSAKSKKFGASGDEDVFRLRRGGDFSHGCQRY